MARTCLVIALAALVEAGAAVGQTPDSNQPRKGAPETGTEGRAPPDSENKTSDNKTSDNKTSGDKTSSASHRSAISLGVIAAPYYLVSAYNAHSYVGLAVQPELRVSHRRSEDPTLSMFFAARWTGLANYGSGKAEAIGPSSSNKVEGAFAVGVSVPISSSAAQTVSVPLVNRASLALAFGNFKSEADPTGYLKGFMVMVSLDADAVAFRFSP